MTTTSMPLSPQTRQLVAHLGAALLAAFLVSQLRQQLKLSGTPALAAGLGVHLLIKPRLEIALESYL